MSLEKLNFIEKHDNIQKNRILNHLNIIDAEKLTAQEINHFTNKIDEIIEYLRTIKVDVSDYKGLYFEFDGQNKIYILRNQNGNPLASLDLNFILDDVVKHSDFIFINVPDWSLEFEQLTNI